jgi:hypothetical protein
MGAAVQIDPHNTAATAVWGVCVGLLFGALVRPCSMQIGHCSMQEVCCWTVHLPGRLIATIAGPGCCGASGSVCCPRVAPAFSCRPVPGAVGTPAGFRDMPRSSTTPPPPGYQHGPRSGHVSPAPASYQSPPTPARYQSPPPHPVTSPPPPTRDLRQDYEVTATSVVCVW